MDEVASDSKVSSDDASGGDTSDGKTWVGDASDSGASLRSEADVELRSPL